MVVAFAFVLVVGVIRVVVVVVPDRLFRLLPENLVSSLHDMET